MLNKILVNCLLDLQFLTLDEALTHLNITHYALRQETTDAPLTDGLRREISQCLSRNDACQEYKLTMQEVDRLLYQDTDSLPLYQRAQQMRDLGHTELHIANTLGKQLMDNSRLSAELQSLRDEGMRVIDIADLYGISHSRVSQLTTSDRKYRRITDAERAQIISSSMSPQQAADHFGTTVNTIYKIRREA